MADCRGQSFTERNETSCEYVKQPCGYGLCQNDSGDHCYGIDSYLNYPAGQYEPAGNETCPGNGHYCPMARDTYYIPDLNGINM